jgi:hypothetical protein
MGAEFTEAERRELRSEVRQWKGHHAEEVRKKRAVHRRLEQTRSALKDALAALDDIAAICRATTDEAAQSARKRAAAAAASAHQTLHAPDEAEEAS